MRRITEFIHCLTLYQESAGVWKKVRSVLANTPEGFYNKEGTDQLNAKASVCALL